MPIELPWGCVVLLNALLWPALQLSLAWGFTRMPAAWFHAPAPMEWEKSGRIYQCILRVRQWKDLLPDGARWFKGGISKRSIGGSSKVEMAAFVRESWRGELCHWAAMAFCPVFFLWNPLWADVVMVAYALIANLPCIVAQRYNRARILRIVSLRE